MILYSCYLLSGFLFLVGLVTWTNNFLISEVVIGISAAFVVIPSLIYFGEKKEENNESN